MENVTRATQTLYTIGHSDRTAEVLVEHLRLHRVRVLVDVRSAPYSRHVPHFNKDAVGQLLELHGIDYRFAGEVLGGRPKDEGVYRGGEAPDADLARADYLKVVDYAAIMTRDWYQRGVARLLQLADDAAANGEYVAVMCSEGNPRECHRHHLIARSLIDPAVRGVGSAVAVRHILRDGTAEQVRADEFIQPPEQMTLF